MDIVETMEKVSTRADLVEFIRILRIDLETDLPNWENETLDSFLEAMAAWVEAMDKVYRNRGKEFSEDQPWNLFAQMLLAAKFYE